MVEQTDELEYNKVGQKMKPYKKYIRNAIAGLAIGGCVLLIGLKVFVHFNPHMKLVGIWHGDGTLDLLWDSPFDGAVELGFYLDHTGYVRTEEGKTAFTYDVHARERKQWDVIILDAGNGYNHGQRFVIDGHTLTILRDDGNIKFTRGQR